MGTMFDERMSRIHDLELARQRRLHQTELLKRDEDARRLKVKALALRDDNATLKDNVSQKDSYYRQWIKQRDQLRAELDEARDMIRSHETRAKKQALEMANLKAEVDSLTTSMQDSGKALQEKFALTRELNRLRPEMEHLQSQLTNHQVVVAEKHDLRRQVDSLEVELENERRARQRTKSKNDDGELHELRSQLQDAEKKLSAAKKEKEKMRREHEKAMADVTSRAEQLEGDETASASKLKQAEADLKEARQQMKTLQQELEACRAELDEAQASVESTATTNSVSVPTKEEAPAKATGAKTKKTTKAKAAPEPTRKRRIEEIGMDDMSIGTPGNDSFLNRPAKKRGFELAAAAEKSNFSITPFLNRNKGLDDVTLEDTPVVPKAPTEDAEEVNAKESKVQAKPSPRKAPAAKTQKPRGRPPKAAAATLSETTASKRNAASQKLAKADAEEASDAEIAEEQENAPTPKKKAPQAAKPQVTAKSDTSSVKPQEQAAGKNAEGDKKKKRKFLGAGTTLFDEEEGEPTRPIAGAAVRRLKAPLGGGSNGFGTFSPLKRHKKGVGASFLV